MQDHVCSPLVEALKAAAGAEYEGVLEARLAAIGVPFATEADLRAGGFARTPVRRSLAFSQTQMLVLMLVCSHACRCQDVRLEAPIAVRGRVVHWIDSKASFADPLVHREKARTQTMPHIAHMRACTYALPRIPLLTLLTWHWRCAQGVPQFQAYVNRYGPGLVIYWLGFVDELAAAQPDVALADAFPDEADIQRLPALPLPLLPPRAAAPAVARDEAGSGELEAAPA
jgi:hypothetical protein